MRSGTPLTLSTDPLKMYGFLKTIEAGLGVLSLLAYGLILGVLFRRPKEFSNAYYGIVKYGGIVVSTGEKKRGNGTRYSGAGNRDGS